MVLNAFTRSPLGAFERSVLSVKVGGSEQVPGSIIIFTDENTHVLDPTTGQWGVIAPGSIRPQQGVWAGGELFGVINNTRFVYRYDVPTDAWVEIGGPGQFPDFIRAICEHNGQIVVSQRVGAFAWNGSVWSQVLTYTGPGMVHPNVAGEQVIDCTSPPGIAPADCVSEQEDLNGWSVGPQTLLSYQGRLYAGGALWDDWTSPNNEALNAHPIVDDTGTIHAIFDAPIAKFWPKTGGGFYARVGTGSTGVVRWRDAWPGCCTSFAPPHYNMIPGATGTNIVTFTPSGSFNPGAVASAFVTQTNDPDIRDLIDVGGTLYATMRFEPEGVLITTDGPHGFNPGNRFRIRNSLRYDRFDSSFGVYAVPAADQIHTRDLQFRGDERADWETTGGGTTGGILSFANAEPRPLSGLYRWTGTDWTPLWTDRDHPEGLPGAYPMVGTAGLGGLYAEAAGQGQYGSIVLTGSTLYFPSNGDSTSLERLDLAGSISRRLCFPQLALPDDKTQPIRMLLKLPDNSSVGNLSEVCPGDFVTSKFTGPANHSIFTCASAHNLTEPDSVDILTSTVPGYVGTYAVHRIVTPTEFSIPVAFVGTATGTWQQTGNPGNNGSFTAVRSGDSVIVYFDLGLDPRPGDIIMTGNQSSTVFDLSGVPYDYSKALRTSPGGVPMTAQRDQRYNRVSPFQHWAMFVRLEYFDAADPGWIDGEPVSLSR